jgi:selT/selW/selH-like putative selenoprotein
LPDAARVAAELKKDLGIDAELVAGRGGVFDVVADGKVIYSKSNTGRFPKPGEVSGLLKQGKG